jgi:hypothetical protein
MRLLVLAAAAFVAVPAVAAPRAQDPVDEQWADSMPNQDEIDAAAGSVDRVAGAIMDLKVGPLIDAVDPDGPRHGDETVGDVARRDDPEIDRKVHDSVGRMSAQMSVLMARLAMLGPELQRSFEEMERSIDRAARDLPDYDEY